MEHTSGTSRKPIGPILAIVGGALLAIGSFLSWAEVSGGGTSVSATGIDGSDGYVTLVAGVVSVAVGLLMMKSAKRGLAILVVLAGLIGGGIGLYDALTAKDSVLDAAAEELAPTVGATAEEVRTLLDQAVDAGELSISISIGLYLVIAGGALALVGGFLSMGGRASKDAPMAGFASETTPPAAEPPAMPTAPPMEPPAPPEGGTG